MEFAQRRACAAFLAASIVALAALWAPEAQAATCQAVPASTTGLDVSIAGQQRRVPGISGITVCVDSPVVPLVSVSTSGNGYCTAGCLSVLAQGGDFDTGGITISYRADGVTQSQSVSGGSLGGPSGSCLLSVGAPDAPYPSCFVALGIDDLPVDPDGIREDVEQLQGAVAQLREDVDEVRQDVQGDLPGLREQVEEELANAQESACDTIPSVSDPDSWGEETRFCDDPVGWVGVIARAILVRVEETIEPIQTLISKLDDIGLTCDNPKLCP